MKSLKECLLNESSNGRVWGKIYLPNDYGIMTIRDVDENSPDYISFKRDGYIHGELVEMSIEYYEDKNYDDIEIWCPKSRLNTIINNLEHPKKGDRGYAHFNYTDEEEEDIFFMMDRNGEYYVEIRPGRYGKDVELDWSEQKNRELILILKKVK